MQFVLLVLVRHYQRQRNRHGREEGRDPDNAGRTMEHQQQQPRGSFLREDTTHRHDNSALQRPLLDEEEEEDDDGETTQAQGNRDGMEGGRKGANVV